MNRTWAIVGVLLLGLLGLTFVAACGDDEDEQEPTATATVTEEEEAEPASEHFSEALEALDAGDLEMVRHHLEEAVDAAEQDNLAGAPGRGPGSQPVRAIRPCHGILWSGRVGIAQNRTGGRG